MILRDLFKENPDHFYDWQAIRHESLTGLKNDPKSLAEFKAKWQSGTANLSEWLKNPNADLQDLEVGLDQQQIQLVRERRHQLFDWWLEYKIQFKFLADLKNVDAYAPHQVKTFAMQKQKELKDHLFGDRQGLVPFIFTNNWGLLPNVDYPALMTELADTYQTLDLIYDKDQRHMAAALLRYKNYLDLLAEEGIEQEEDDFIPGDFTFEKYWPEITGLSRKIVIENMKPGTLIMTTPLI